MQVRRDIFLKRLIARRRNGLVKVITGLRRCGKSYLLGVLYKDYLLADGVGQDHIIEVALDEPGNYKYHNPLKLEKHLKRQIKDKGDYYVFIDEVQFVKRVKVRDPELEEKDEITFCSVINSLMRKGNVDVYSHGVQLKDAFKRHPHGEGGLWVRPARMFFASVDRDGKRMKRFELVEAGA